MPMLPHQTGCPLGGCAHLLNAVPGTTPSELRRFERQARYVASDTPAAKASLTNPPEPAICTTMIELTAVRDKKTGTLINVFK